MKTVSASAPGKIILLGEHAVVYDQPAVAVPVSQVQATAWITSAPDAAPESIFINAPQVQISSPINELAPDQPLAAAVWLALSRLHITQPPAFTLTLQSDIPIAAGLGSGAATSVAIIRALSRFFNQSLPEEEVSALAFEVEKIHHGHPSGIDNTVITWEKPVFYQKNLPVELIDIPAPLTFVIANTGISAPTAKIVMDVRRRYSEAPVMFEQIFSSIGEISRQGVQAIRRGNLEELGSLMNANQDRLEEIGVSSPELDHLIASARQAGAWGAKLSGAGKGGNMIALVRAEDASKISDSLREAGAVQTFTTTVQPSPCLLGEK